jgi:pimeloyl-ACP methyl ester carboxylesterase
MIGLDMPMTLRWEPPNPGRGRLVLVHGELSHAATWWRIGPALAEQGWQVLAPDMPGHGATARVDRPLHLPRLVQGVAEQLPGQVDVLVGHGLGAVVALALANRYPELTRAVVLEEPPSSRAEDRAALISQIAADSAVARSSPHQLADRLRHDHPRWDAADIEHAITGVTATDVPALLAGLRAPHPWDLPTLLGTLRVPALLLVAPETPDPPETGEASALRGLDRKSAEAMLPPERFTVLHGGHHLHRDVPDQWIKVVTDFAYAVCPAPDAP